MFKDIVYQNRSYRRFYQEHKIEKDVLTQLVDYARMAASGANLQSLKYIISCEADKNKIIYDTLGWAAYLKDWSGPEEGERPSGYVVVMNDGEITKTPWCEAGIAAENIMLGAVAHELGGCIFRNIKKEELAQKLHIPAQYEIMMVLALGKPKEIISIDELGEDGSIQYWRDESKVHHVPKRALCDILLDL